MPKYGFLGTSAPLGADIALTIEVAMALALLLGMLLARRHRYRAHAWCQSAVVVLNVFVIARIMAPSFRSQVAPKIPARLGRPFYGIATAHAAVGCIAELLGIYIVLAAGTTVLPARLRLVRYKPWMRTALLIWWLAVLLGLATYARWYPLDASRLRRVPFPICGGIRRTLVSDSGASAASRA
jgi:uncharacterized membrane protein YozB (DUF420 family)